MVQHYGYRTTDGWAKIYRHNVAGGYWSNASSWAEVRQSNIDNPNADKYSQLFKLNSNFLINGEYVFKMYMPNDGNTNIWAQTHNPLENAPTAATVPGYRAISIDSSANAWGGLSLADGTSSFIDGNPANTNWYYPLGPTAAWNSGIPAHLATGIPILELYVRVR